MMISRGGAENAVDTFAGAAAHESGFSVGFATGPAERNVLYTRRNFDGNAGVSREVSMHEFDEVYGNVSAAAGPAVLGLADISAAFGRWAYLPTCFGRSCVDIPQGSLETP